MYGWIIIDTNNEKNEVESWMGYHVYYIWCKPVHPLWCFFKSPLELLIFHIQKWIKCIYQWCKWSWWDKVLQGPTYLYYLWFCWWQSKEHPSGYWLSHHTICWGCGISNEGPNKFYTFLLQRICIPILYT